MENITALWKQIQSPDFALPAGQGLLDQVMAAARTSQTPAQVSFGTSGWRAEIGSEFTLRNLQVVGKALVRLYREADTKMFEALGIKNFEELQKRGLVIGHDNRLLGHEFCAMVADQFLKAGVKVLYADEASTPEFSAAVEMLGAACAVNMTPSHNPSHYNGIKFNPADGGPAGPEITNVITQLSNEMMSSHVWEPVDIEALAWERFDILKVYREFLIKQGTIKFSRIQSLVKSGRLTLVVDYVHGSTRGRPAFLLDNPTCLVNLRTETDPLFGGIAPEPSSKNLEGVRRILDASKSWYRLGVIFDPDGDRVRFYDGTREIDMNAFGAIAFHYMATWRKQKGVVAKSVATSNFVNIIAEGLGRKVAETPVGFKNFRKYLRRGAKEKALVAFEESDGISGLNNTLEKDAQFGLLLALEIMAVTGKNLGEYLDALYREYGRLYPQRSGFEVDKSLVGVPLTAKVKAIAEKAQPGMTIQIGNVPKTVKQLLTLDGTKVIFADSSWMLIRPSGTEPKVRIYTETRTPEEKDAMFEAAKALFFG
ncbi:MAG TPA: phosphomannomutase [Fibrobacteraceae bacterium]|nr:phosphomannomutase [Fibrobacteraceae bacterium]